MTKDEHLARAEHHAERATKTNHPGYRHHHMWEAKRHIQLARRGSTLPH